MDITATRPDALPTLSTLKPGAHLCSLYETEEEHRTLLTPFLRQGLEQGEKVLYIVDARTAETILSYLRNDGLDVDPLLKRGQLGILTVREAYLREGTFDPDRMIALLRAATEQAVAEGYPALRVTGEMTWALRGLPGSEQLIEYEAKLNNFFPGSRCLALCQYDRRRFTPDVQLDILATHPMVAVGTELHDNPYYLPPAAFLAKDRSEARLEQWLNNLAARKQMDATLRRMIHDRGERVKELTCLYKSARLLQDRTKLPADLLQELAALLPPAWQYPEITAARITLDGQASATPNFAETPWKQSAAFETADGKRGTIEVVYLEEKPDEVEGPFLAEERNLINAVADSLVSYRERKQTEEALRASEETFRAISASAQDAVILLDHEGKISFWNQAAERIFGYPAHEALGRELHRVCAPERFREAYRRGWAQFRETGQGPVVGKTLELVAQRRNGSEFPIELSVSAVKLGGRWNAVGILRDIAERKQAQEALMREKSFSEATLNSLPGIFYLIDEDGHFLRWNWNLETTSGYTADEIRRMRALDLFKGDDKALITERIRECFATGRAEAEAGLVSKEGVSQPFFFTGVRFQADDRSYLVGMGVDLTQRKKAEEDLERFFALSLDLLCIVGVDGYFKRVNRAFVSTFGHSETELLAVPFAEFIHPDDRAGTNQVVARLAEGERLTYFENRYRCKDGSYRWLAWTAQARGGLIYAVARDVTEQKQVQERLQRINRDLRMVSLCNQALIRASDEATFLEKICRILVETGEYRTACVCVLEPAAGTAEPSTSRYGFPADYLASVTFTWADLQRMEPIATAMRTGRPAAARRIFTDPVWARWRDEASRFGYASFIALPLLSGEDRIGLVQIHSQDPDAFDAEAVELLAELADDAAYGVRQLRLRAERQRLSEQLISQGRTLDAFFLHSVTPLVILDRAFNFIRVNEAYAKACQREVSEFAGHNHFEFYPSDAQAIFEEVVRTGRPYQTVARPFAFPDHPEWGVTYWDWTLTPILDRRGAVESLVFSLNDVTERERAEEAVRQSEARQSLILHSVPMVLYTARPFGDYGGTWVSDNIEQVAGFPPKRFTDDPSLWVSRLHPDDRAAALASMRAAVERGGASSEYRWQCADGRYRWLLDRSVLVRDEAGQPKELIGIWLDITERKQMERHAQRIEQLASMGQLLGGIVHELKNPLFVVTGRLQLLKEKLANREYDGLEPDLQKIGDAAQRMGGIAQRFLTLARPIQPTLQLCSVAAILKGVLDFLSNELMKARITVVTEYAADLPPCRSDP
ncbi:MAG: PAS domain S-box protein, partial [Nitrospirae bacterium]